MAQSFLRFVPLLVLAVACSAQAPSASRHDEGAAVESVASPIINGTADTAHSAVVALILQQGNSGGLCSGTIVKKDVDRGIGWVATAAHCVDIPPAIVVQAPDFSKSDSLRYSVIDYLADPQYDPSNGHHDFAMVRIAGVDASTPVIPLTTSPDGVAKNTPVTSVGFGRTSLTEPTTAAEQNTKRYFVQKTLDDVDTQLIGYDMATRGICQGDSGGPVLVGSGASEKVVGIHSFVQGDCSGRGYSARVTAGLAFFNAQLGKALPPETCSLCEQVANSGKNTCAAATDTCFADPDCRAYYECLSARKKPATCLKEHPLAEGPFNAAANCVCVNACVTQCESSPSCSDVPKCGYKRKKGDCASCIEASCCEEQTECATDGQCYVCLKNKDADAKCATNAARKKLATCAAKSCKTECADDSVQAGGDDGNGDEVVEEEPAAETPPTAAATSSGCAAGGTSSSSPFVAVLGIGLALAHARRRRR